MDRIHARKGIVFAALLAAGSSQAETETYVGSWSGARRSAGADRA